MESSPNQTLKENYNVYFDENYQLRQIDTNQKLKSGNPLLQQLQVPIQLFIQTTLKTKYNLQQIWLPLQQEDPSLNIFISQDFYSNPQKSLLLIQGAGGVRAGQWSRSVCARDSLTNGSVFPFLDQAQHSGYSVIIFNPNLNRNPKTKVPILGNSNFREHGEYMWRNFIQACPAQQLYIVAHSCGGPLTLHMLNQFPRQFQERVKAIAFTDSVHGSVQNFNARQKDYLYRISANWVCSQQPRDQIIRIKGRDGCVNLSAGHNQHEYTTGFAFPSIFGFFESIKQGINPYISR